jgi:hypothetical protein
MPSCYACHRKHCRLLQGGGLCRLYRQGSALVLSLASRKNLPRGNATHVFVFRILRVCCLLLRLQGATLQRGCWCKQSPKTCPVHVVGPYLDQHGEGQPLFAGVTATSTLKVLRQMLGALNVEGACDYRTHDLRRGHAKDLQQSGTLLSCGHDMCIQVPLFC